MNSPFLNKSGRESLSNVLAYLRPFHPTYDQADFTKSNLANYLGSKYDSAAIDRLFNRLLDLLKQFLSLRNLLTDEFNVRYQLLYFYLEHTDLLPQFEEEYSKLRPLAAHDLYKNYQLSQRYTDYLMRKPGEQFKDDMGVQAVSDHLDIFYISKKIEYACILLNRNLFSKQPIDLSFLTEILKYINQNETVGTAIKPTIYYKMLLLLLNEQEAQYFEVVEAMQQLNNSLDTDKQQDLFRMLENYCILQINQGKRTFHDHLFELFNLQLEKGTLYINNQLQTNTFRQIVKNALRLERLDWLEQFLQTHKNRIEAAARDVYWYGHASLCFERKGYTDTLRYLLKIPARPDDVFYNLDVRKLKIKTQYEATFSGTQDLSVELQNELKNFRHYLSATRACIPRITPPTLIFTAF